MPFKSLSDMRVSERAVISGFVHESEVHERLKEMGLVAGTTVRVKRFAPLGDPMEIIVRGYALSIRKEDARGILVSPEVS